LKMISFPSIPETRLRKVLLDIAIVDDLMYS